MKRFLGLLLAVALLVSCSGCSLNFFSVESLLSPPMQGGKNGEVQAAFNELKKNEKIQLKTPVAGNYQTSFVLFDINNDKSDEAFIFYTDSSVDASVRMALLQCIDDEWVICDDIKGAGNGVYDVDFSDLNNDGISEVFVSWSLFESKVKRITSIFSPSVSNDGKVSLNSLGSENCNAKNFVDFNGDNKNDLVIVYHDDTGEIQKTYLRLFSLSQTNELVKYGEIPLDSAITTISGIQSDVVTGSTEKYTRLFIDCQKSEKTIFTEMVYWDSSLSIPVRAFTEPSLTTARSYKARCMDIDADGLLEIPVVTRLYGDEKQFSVTYYDDVYTFTLLEWIHAKGDTTTENFKTLNNPLDMYLLVFPWGSEVSVKYDSVRDALIYYRWNERSQKYGDELFSVSCRENNQEENKNVLYEDDSSIYYYEITPQGTSFGITEELLEKSFIKNQ